MSDHEIRTAEREPAEKEELSLPAQRLLASAKRRDIEDTKRRKLQAELAKLLRAPLTGSRHGGRP